MYITIYLYLILMFQGLYPGEFICIVDSDVSPPFTVCCKNSQASDCVHTTSQSAAASGGLLYNQCDLQPTEDSIQTQVCFTLQKTLFLPSNAETTLV